MLVVSGYLGLLWGRALAARVLISQQWRVTAYSVANSRLETRTKELTSYASRQVENLEGAMKVKLG